MQKLLRSRVMIVVLSGVIVVLLLDVWWTSRHSRGSPSGEGQTTAQVDRKPVESHSEAPIVDPVEYRPLSADEAVAVNAQQSTMATAGPAAAPFYASMSPADTIQAQKCLADAIYYEAASQDVAGQRAVAQVVLNRVRNPAFPANVCSVVYQGAERVTGCQFSFTCDGSLLRPATQSAWSRAQRVAKAALQGFVFAPVGNATHYHADYVVPYWASSLTRATTIGAHIFYRWRGRWGEPQAFRQRYFGPEADHRPVLQLAQGLTVSTEMPIVDASVANHRHAASNLIQERKKVPSMLADHMSKQSRLLVDRRPPMLIASLMASPRIIADDQQTASNRFGGKTAP